MKVGILGYTGCGKTTLFNLLTGMSADVGFSGDRKPNLGVIKVPDDRIDKLSAMYNPKKTTYAEIRFVDIAGKTPDGTPGGLDPALLTHIRDTEAITLVVRGFDSPMHEKTANAISELRDVETELQLADMAIIEKRLDRLKREQKGGSREVALLEQAMAQLDQGQPLRKLVLRDDDELTLRGFRFLSQKPALVLVNTDEADPTTLPADVQAYCDDQQLVAMPLCAGIESELSELETEEQVEFLAEYGIDAPARDRYIRAAYDMLDLISFFTTGEDEVRAWTITRGTPAARAAGKIHSDLEKGFIRAEITPYLFLMELGSEQAVKAAGKMGVEGKEYVVQDGDICHIRFNV
jgi:GTP-binding protein YchF